MALSWLPDFPEVILATAWLMAVVVMAVVIGSAFGEARAARIGFVSAGGKSLQALGRFVFWFF